MSLEADAASLLSSATLQNIDKALQYGSQINFSQAVAAFKTANLAGEIQTVDDVLKVIGVFVPPVAIAANDISAAEAGFNFLLTLGTLAPGSLSNNAGETQAQDVQSSVGL